MPYAKRRYRKRRKRRGGSKKVTLSKRQARTKAYDSIIEKVIVRVHKQERAKEMRLLTKRVYWFGTYDLNTNIFGASMPVTWGGPNYRNFKYSTS